jgi:hypothetical protein
MLRKIACWILEKYSKLRFIDQLKPIEWSVFELFVANHYGWGLFRRVIAGTQYLVGHGLPFQVY